MSKASRVSFEGNFERKSPASFADKIGIPNGWTVVHYRHIPEKSVRRQTHGEWFKISSPLGSIYRVLRFSGNLKKGGDFKTGQIVLDWLGWIDLHDRYEDVDGPIYLWARKAYFWELPIAYARHPDGAIRLASWLGWASVVLGAVSLIATFAK